jgi:6-phosphogluconate dehydrogenase
VVKKVAGAHAQPSTSIADLIAKLDKPRAVRVMVPAGATGGIVRDLALHIDPGDIIVDGGNSYYRDGLERAKALKERGIHYIDCSTSGGVFGLQRGFCLMIGGEVGAVQHLDPIFQSIAPGVVAASRTRGRKGPPSHAENGYFHCGQNGAGHFVKMVHNGIEYGLMAAYAEGLNILNNADVGLRQQEDDAETTPLRDPDAYKYQLDLGQIAEVWRL